MSLAEALLDLQQLTRRLRRECPWDREQTARTIVPHTVEEAYEVADAALETVAREVHAKLVRRHPHVFGDAEARTPGRVRERWEELKTEQEGREGIFHDVPDSLPALLQARKVQRRAAAVGYDWPDLAGPLAKAREEIDELASAADVAGEPLPETEPDPAVFHEIGDVLFTVVNVARRVNVDPELALRATTRRFTARVELAAELAEAAGEDWRNLDLEAQDEYYERAKERLA